MDYLKLLLLCLWANMAHAAMLHIQLQTLGPKTALFPGLLYYAPDAQGQLQLRGRYRDLLDCTASHMSIEIHYSGKPFARAQRDAEEGQIQGFFPANHTHHRDQFAIMSAPLFNDRKIVLHRAEFHRGSTPSDSPLAFVGVMRGAQYEQAVAETLGHPIAVVDSYHQLIRMIDSGRLGAMVGSEMFIHSALSRIQLTHPLMQQPLQEAPMYAYFAQSFIEAHPGFLSRFNQALDRCRDNH